MLRILRALCKGTRAPVTSPLTLENVTLAKHWDSDVLGIRGIFVSKETGDKKIRRRVALVALTATEIGLLILY